ncbi:hypothetical protein BGZ60DRAFT_393182 [Tricladium varicosporioides]|nr:hypothetical protein BGZ60DRAFT_393182 [Hymenoscyphus varicosporioides]
MARVTRSRKIDIAEDLNTLAIETPLPNTPNLSALNEIDINEGTNKMVAAEESSVHDQLKSLKAAYRSAIGAGKRGKKGKSRKKDQLDQEQTQQENLEEGHTANGISSGLDSSMPEQFRLSVPSHEGSLVSLLDNIAIPHLTQDVEAMTMEQPQLSFQASTGRMTRHQLAKQQAGQYYSSDISDTFQRSSMNVLQAHEFSFLSLFNTRACTISNQKENLENGMTDRPFYLAEEALAKSMLQANSFLKQDGPAQAETSMGSEIKHSEPLSKTNNDKTPAVITLAEVEAHEEGNVQSVVDDTGDDSFVEQIICRSPAKPVSRIEDSVEALDQLEEAMEALDQAAMVETMVSPEKTRRKVQTGRHEGPLHKKTTIETTTKTTSSSNQTKQTPLKSGYGSMRIKSTNTKQAPTLKKAASMSFRPGSATHKPAEEKKIQTVTKPIPKRPVSLLPPKEPTKSTKPPTRPTFELPGESVARKLKEQREARLAQRQSGEESAPIQRAVSGPKVAKSTKPPTKADFELPGEALSRRKREALEARLKAQEEEERKRREFKAKPIRKSIVPDYVPRETVASRARQSRIGIESMDGTEISVSKRSSMVGGHRPSLQQLNIANMSAPRNPGPNRQLTRKPSTTNGPSMSGLSIQRGVSDKEVQIQRQRAKEIYNRDARLTEDMEREKQEREAAAKRAREEAAERGRQASREWAEKQRAKRLVEGDKGMGAGYGPGGQMGLKG